MKDVEVLYEDKVDDYYSTARVEVLKLVDGANNRILDIGCGTGATGLALKRNGQAGEVCGIELIKAAADEAAKNLDHVVVGNIEEMEIPFEHGSFDYVLATDVLEHLYNPWKTLHRMAKFLRKGGHVIVIVPNTQNWRIVRDLVFRGDWGYVQKGLLDKTHIRFFTKKTLFEMLEDAGFRNVEIIPGFRLHPRGYRASLINSLTFGLFTNFWTHHRSP